MNRLILVIAASLLLFAGTSAPAATRPPYDPFAMQRAAQAQGSAENAAFNRRQAIIKRLKDHRMKPPKRQPLRSPTAPDHDRGHGNDPDGHDEDNPGNSQGPGPNPGNGNGNGNGNGPPPFTPPGGGGTGTNPGGNTPGNGNANNGSSGNANNGNSNGNSGSNSNGVGPKKK